MKPNMHPEYLPVKVACACGAHYETRSGRLTDFTVDICASCHPFFTGKQKLMDTEGRVERFRNKYTKIIAENAEKAEKAKLVTAAKVEGENKAAAAKKAKAVPEAKA